MGFSSEFLFEIKEYFKKLRNYIYKKISIYKKEIYKNEIIHEYFNYDNLAPKSNLYNSNQQEYIRALKYALNQKEITNIAITAPYGAGKSTILKVFKNTCHKTFINISLASFEDINNIHTKQEEIMQQIEKSILQQMFYSKSPLSFKFSRLKRIINYDQKRTFLKIFFATIWFLLTLMIFIPSLFEKNYFFPKSTDWLWIEFASWLIISFWIVWTISAYVIHAKLSKFSIKNFEIDLNKNNDDSLLNKFVDEIVYFFEVSKIEVVVFEDLDRFKKYDIFRKLRELNILLNNAEQVQKKPITFIFAIGDDIFTTESRTKFFDFILPIVPIVNSTNSKEILKKKIKDVNTNLLSKISLYIDDMRMLINIANEYHIYKSQIGELRDELFAMIVYKNIYPKDFADLNKNKGIVFDLFNSKKVALKEKLLLKINDEIKKIENDMDALKNEIASSLTELRAIFIGYCFQHFTQQYNNEAIKQIISDEAIFDKHIINNNQMRKTFSAIEEENKTSYVDRKNNIQKILSNKTQILKKELHRLTEIRNEINNMKLNKLIMQTEEYSIFDIENKTNSLLRFLVLDGLIDERYYHVISFFHEGALTYKDREYLFKVWGKNSPNFDYKFDDVKNFASELHIELFSTHYIYNFELFDYIIINKRDYFKMYIETLKDGEQKAFDFFTQYMYISHEKKDLFELISKECSEIWKIFRDRLDYADEKINYLFVKLIRYAKPEDLEKINSDIKQLSIYSEKRIDFLNITDTDGLDLIEQKIKFVSTIMPIFKKLDKPKNGTQLLIEIYNNRCYELNYDMIKMIISELSENEFNENDFETKNYTSILQSNCDDLKTIITENLSVYINTIMLRIDKNTCEHIEVITSLLNNEDIHKDTRIELIKKEIAQHEDIREILNKELWMFIFKENRVKQTWKNVLEYFEEFRLDEILIQFIKNKLSITSDSDNNLFENYGDDIFYFIDALIESEDISANDLEEFFEKNSLLGYAYNFSDDAKIKNDKVHYLVKNKYIKFNSENFSKINTFHSELKKVYIECNFETFMQDVSSYAITSNDVVYFIKSKTIDNDYKKAFLSKLSIPLIDSQEIADNIFSFIQANDIQIGLDFIIALINSFSKKNNEIKVQLVINQERNLKNDEIIQLLNYLPEYRLFKLNGKTLDIDKKWYNEDFAKILNKRKLITSYKPIEDSKKLRLRSKNKSK